MGVIIPKVFISYSRKCLDRVILLANRLVDNGIDVVIDIWNLLPGQDKYAFMERSVTDTSITKVLIICDNSYTEKANDRKGGVGDETMVISPDVYAKATETKYIPIIFERDENGKEYVPAYLKSRIYIDMSSDELFEKEYDKLLRNLYNKPEHSKPPLGKMPEWLNDEPISLTPVLTAIRKLKTDKGDNQMKRHYLIKQFNDEFIKALKGYAPVYDKDFDDNILKQIDASKPLRDIFYDYVEMLIIEGYSVNKVLGDFFEQAYNDVYKTEVLNSYKESEFEFGFFLVWEMFIGITAILLHYESYSELWNMLNRTYFLNEKPYAEDPQPCSFIQFFNTFEHLENRIKPKLEGEKSRLLTLAGDIAIKRERLPILRAFDIANADIVLYQLSEALNVKKTYSWFPIMYVYMKNGLSMGKQLIWAKMVSKRHCENLYPLFNVKSVEQLKDAIMRNIPNPKLHYPGDYFNCVPEILNSIKIEDIATLV